MVRFIIGKEVKFVEFILTRTKLILSAHLCTGPILNFASFNEEGWIFIDRNGGPQKFYNRDELVEKISSYFGVESNKLWTQIIEKAEIDWAVTWVMHS